MGKWTIPVLTTIVITGGLIGCVFARDGGFNSPKTGVSISGMTTGIGGVGDDHSEQTFSYAVFLHNETRNKLHIESIKPVLSSGFAELALTGDNVVSVDETLGPGTTIEVKGDIQFDTQGLSKTEILQLKPFMTDVKVASEIVLALPGRGD